MSATITWQLRRSQNKDASMRLADGADPAVGIHTTRQGASLDSENLPVGLL